VSQTNDRNTRLESNDGNALAMGMFRPDASWYEEYWLTEAPPAAPGPFRRCLTGLTALTSRIAARLRPFIADKSIAHIPVPDLQDAR
jgi:hypothetical protein